MPDAYRPRREPSAVDNQVARPMHAESMARETLNKSSGSRRSASRDESARSDDADVARVTASRRDNADRPRSPAPSGLQRNRALASLLSWRRATHLSQVCSRALRARRKQPRDHRNFASNAIPGDLISVSLSAASANVQRFSESCNGFFNGVPRRSTIEFGSDVQV
jgi:hypothetical protein